MIMLHSKQQDSGARFACVAGAAARARGAPRAPAPAAPARAARHTAQSLTRHTPALCCTSLPVTL